MRFAPYVFCSGLALLALLACGSSASTTTVVVRPELIAVDPDDFLGSVRCASAVADDAGAVDSDPDAARSYVATLFDVTPTADGGVPDPGTPLASSLPTTCQAPVTFSYVVTGHRYLAEVDAYRERPDELTPISAGSRLLSNASGTRVVAGWVATCGAYPPSPEAGTESGGAPGTSDGTRPAGVIAYDSITQTPHNCSVGLLANAPN